MLPDYEKEPLEIFEETVWVVNDPWMARDIATFTDQAAAEVFKNVWEGRYNNG